MTREATAGTRRAAEDSCWSATLESMALLLLPSPREDVGFEVEDCELESVMEAVSEDEVPVEVVEVC